MTTNFEQMAWQNDRMVIRCLNCGLVQFMPHSACRRCHVGLFMADEAAGEENAVERESADFPRRQRPRQSGVGSSKVAGYDFIAAMRVCRQAAQLTQAQLAGRMGTQRSQINKLESGRTLPLVGTYERIARAIGIPLRLLCLTAQALGEIKYSKDETRK